MAERAKISSVEAIEEFRSHLIVYLSKARPTMEEVSAELMRTRQWLENDRRTHWEAQVRKCRKKLEDAQQTLYTARAANLRDVTTSEQQAVRNAEKAIQQAEEKLKLVKKWCREFDSRVMPLSRPLEKVNTILANLLPEGIALLGKTVKTLHEYSGTSGQPLLDNPPPTTDSPAAAPATEAGATDDHPAPAT